MVSFELCSNLEGARAINPNLGLLLLRVTRCCMGSDDGLMSLGDAQGNHDMQDMSVQDGTIGSRGIPFLRLFSAHSPHTRSPLWGERGLHGQPSLCRRMQCEAALLTRSQHPSSRAVCVSRYDDHRSRPCANEFQMGLHFPVSGTLHSGLCMLSSTGGVRWVMTASTTAPRQGDLQ